MKALTLMSLKIGKKTYKASTDEKPVVVDLDQNEFDRLSDMLAVRKPTANELKLAEVEDAEVVEEKPAKKPAAKAASAKAAETSKAPKAPKAGASTPAPTETAGSTQSSGGVDDTGLDL